MKLITTRLVLLSTTPFLAASLWAQTEAKDCSRPAVLRVTKVGNDLYFQLNGNKKHKLYTLGEVSHEVTSCSPERLLFVVADPNVSPMEMLTPGKEQITNVRYFVRFKTGDLMELSYGSIFPKLPLTPDVKGTPLNQDEPLHSATTIPRGSK